MSILIHVRRVFLLVAAVCALGALGGASAASADDSVWIGRPSRFYRIRPPLYPQDYDYRIYGIPPERATVYYSMPSVGDGGGRRSGLFGRRRG